MANLENAGIVEVFPTPIFAHKVPAAEMPALNQHLEAVIGKMLSPRPKIRPGENWQTANNIQDRDEFDPLIPYIEAGAGRVVKFLNSKAHDICITGLWANVSPPGGAHMLHTHANNFLSGVYYVKAEPGADKIMFHEPRLQTMQIMPPLGEATRYTTTQFGVDVPTGTLVLFPSWLPHSVPVNESKSERISIAFNIMFNNFEKTVSRPLWVGQSEY